jgi:hypothetical protein
MAGTTGGWQMALLPVVYFCRGLYYYTDLLYTATVDNANPRAETLLAVTNDRNISLNDHHGFRMEPQ